MTFFDFILIVAVIWFASSEIMEHQTEQRLMVLEIIKSSCEAQEAE